MTRWMRIASETVAVCLLACLSALAQPVEAPPLQKRPIDLPDAVVLPATLRMQPSGLNRKGVPTIIVSLDESPMEHAAIATGLNANVVSPEVSKRLKMATVGGQVKIDVMDATAAAGQVEMQRFMAATVDLPKLAFAVADVPGMLSARLLQDPPAVWLGTPFLSAFQVTIDPFAGDVTLKKATTALPRTRGTSIVPLVIRDNRPYVRVSIPGAKPFLALIDTTSPGTVIPTDVGEKLKLKPSRVETISWRDGKPGKAAFAVVPKLAVGKAEWTSAPLVYLTSESSKEYDRTFAVLGMDFIGQFRVTIDFARGQMALSRPEQAAPTGAAKPQ
jgi:hypothetical protein